VTRKRVFRGKVRWGSHDGQPATEPETQSATKYYSNYIPQTSACATKTPSKYSYT